MDIRICRNEASAADNSLASEGDAASVDSDRGDADICRAVELISGIGSRINDIVHISVLNGRQERRSELHAQQVDYMPDIVNADRGFKRIIRQVSDEAVRQNGSAGLFHVLSGDIDGNSDAGVLVEE